MQLPGLMLRDHQLPLTASRISPKILLQLRPAAAGATASSSRLALEMIEAFSTLRQMGLAVLSAMEVLLERKR